MALGFLRGLAQPFVKSMAIKGMGANWSLNVLKAAGLSYRRMDFLLDYRTYAKIPDIANKLKFIRKSYRPSKDLFLKPRGFQAREFSYVVKYDRIDPTTGEKTDYFNRLSSAKELTRGQIEEGSAFVVEKGKYDPNVDTGTATLFSAWHTDTPGI